MKKKDKPETKNRFNREKANKLIKQLVYFGVVTFSIVFLINIQTHLVSGDSMNPSLQNKDRLLIVKGKRPSRYSLVTFQSKEDKKKSFVKRVIGLPGDRVWLDQNTVYLNHQMVDTNPTPPNETNLSGVELPDGTLKVRVSWEVAAKIQGMTTIPENQFFVLGDNRRNSADSRNFGLVDLEQIEGVVSFRYYPLNKLGYVE